MTKQTIKIQMNYKQHPKHISYEYVLRPCKFCGELYYNIVENFYGMVSNKKMNHTVYDQTKPFGNNPFINHLQTHEEDKQ